MPDNDLKIKLQVQNQKANKQLKDTGKQIQDIERKAKGANGNLDRMRVATSGLRRSMGALRNNLLLVSFALGGFVTGIAKAVSAANEQELAEKKLATALGRRSQALLDQASALQTQTAFGDEAIISAQALIAAFIDDEEQVKAATEATLDLAAAKGMDLNAAADMVAKSLGSSTNALGRYGIEVKGAVGSTERLETLTKNVADVFGGQATEQAKTFTGELKQMSNALGDTAEDFGDLLKPLLIPVANALKAIAKGTSEVLVAFRKAFSEKQVSLIVGNKLAMQEFNDVINKSSDKDLVHLAHAMSRINILTDIQVEKIKALRQELQERGLLEELLGEKEILRHDRDQSRHARAVRAFEFEKNLKKFKESEFDLSTEQSKARLAQEEKERQSKVKLMRQTAAQINTLVGGAKVAARMQQTAAMIDALSAANSAISKPPTGYGPTPLGWVMYATALSKGIGNAMKISQSIGDFKAAATGMNEVVSEPTMILAGENGAESVQITPLEGPNIDGPQGSGITVNVSGNVLTQDFVTGELAENIKEAVRRGTDFGIG